MTEPVDPRAPELRPDSVPLPRAVREIFEVLVAMPGVVAVALGGSRGVTGAHDGSDWDLAVYYRGAIVLDALAPFGTVHPPGAWGRIMNGGAWFQRDGVQVDVILRDLDAVLYWTRAAEAGEFEIDGLLGYLAGVPTYSLAAEMASGRVLFGELPALGGVPPRLVASAPPRWRFARDFSLEYAGMLAARANVVGAVGHVARAAMEEAHARMCERGEWVLNEKRLLESAGLGALATRFTRVPESPDELSLWVRSIAHALSRGPTS